ncbi:MAG: HAMP domain-containing protein [Deltaproteobacteria bacterium]|jgi:nitrogen fixation/metabolism regulation signal transduction histidine kinase|nr:HAMP domain-containing protein [Deltaproteobacteria bacterium]MBW2531927.1 HAMP domain-containing protein [Deltaproteobacteria bacterium]
MADETKPGPTKHKRYLKNYLLDRGYQLKYAGYLAGVAAVLSIGLGVLLWQTSQSLVAESREAVKQGEQMISLGRKVAQESRKVTAVVQMTMEKTYGDDPELMELFKKDSAKQEAPLKQQLEALEDQAAQLEQRSARLAGQQRAMLITLIVVLSLLVLGVGCAGIVVTHKVAGPIFKMTKQLEALGEGHWEVPRPLRKGDELVSFFGSFREMVIKLRDRREKEIDMLDATLKSVEDDDTKSGLKDLREEMSKVLDG